MEKIKSKKLLKILIICFTLLLTTLMFLPHNGAEAANLTMGTANYEGTTYHCRYNIVASSTTISGNIIDDADFKINLEYKETNWNFLSKVFKYNIQFTLKKSGIVIKETPLSFNVSNAASRIDYAVFSTSDLSGTGNYTLSWYGTISSNDVATLSGTYDFVII